MLRGRNCFFCWCLTLLCVFLFQVLRHTEERWHLRYGEEFEKKLRGMDFDINYTANSALHFGSCCKSLDSGGLTISPLEFGQRGLGLKPGRVVVLGSLEGHFALTRPLSTSPGLSPSRSVFGIRKLSRKLDKMPWRGVNIRWASIPSREGSNTCRPVMLQKPG